MKRHLFAAVAMGLVLLLPAPAFACVPVPAKSWNGTIQFVAQATIGQRAFTANNCQWLDPQLNGVDSRSFDVASHKGLEATATWTTTHPVKPLSVDGFFYTADCVGISGYNSGQLDEGKPVKFTIPSNAKWLYLYPTAIVPSKDISVKITSPGRKCPTT